MHSIVDPGEMQAWAKDNRRRGQSVALVPTMGALHAGHLSLVELARQHADLVVVSLFVNPTQFGPEEDFASYPRDVARDADRCRAAGVDILFRPEPATIYAADATVSVVERGLSGSMCGQSRPGHFDGVVTVVAKLFNLVLPDIAVFGQKDAQQLAIIRRLVRDLNIPVQVIAGEIVRESDGLAMSSRNRYLSVPERAQAPAIYAALQQVRDAATGGVMTARQTEGMIKDALSGAAPAFELEYVTVCDAASLVVREVISPGTLIAVAGRLGATRLIDNLIV